MGNGVQVMMAGTDTPLSLAADDFLDALKEYQDSKEVYENAREQMAKALNDAGKNETTHRGKRIVFVEGKQTKDTVKVLEDKF